MPRPVTALPRHLALAYGLLIVYACLHPLSGWQASGLPLLDYLAAPWPKYYRVEDIALNILGFVPFGFVLAPALPARLGRIPTIVLATLVAALLSFALETAQNFLPTRVSSNVDLGCNILGALLGALAGSWGGHRLFDREGLLQRWRTRHFVGGHTGDIGLVLLALWLLAQLVPDNLPFGSGDFRNLLELPAPVSFGAERFMRFEALVTATSLLAVGLFGRSMMRSNSIWPIAALAALGIAVKTLATYSFFPPDEALIWATPGARHGLAIGLGLLALALLLPAVVQHALAGVALLAATVLINLMPENPYLLLNRAVPNQGNFLHFHGLTGLVASLWPFLALAYLSALGLWRGDHLQEQGRI